ncbi:C4-dicarboxylic acid transporter DauA [Thiorhodospira sibirica]|uniref:C4-dicarboxylic acid transporter DauA n=1 Tax=Thiorhodospira sibirica TaxID=154347 RepID=UPI00022C22B0|nr:C4-dicarboxylic acid transporter DauA [Thiorhodospira sibirica]
MSNRLRELLPLLSFLDAWRAGYGWAGFRADVMAGTTVGIVAIPLAMALAIAVDVPPQHGLYTAIVAGTLIALTGGSRFSVSGPTAAFVVILLPITHQYGLGGLLLATLMAGILLVAMGAAGMGRLMQFIPYPVVIGFTAGIAVVIFTLQIKDFLGLLVTQREVHFLDNVVLLVEALPTLRWEELSIGLLTLVVLLGWNRLPTRIPSHLVALAVAGCAGWLMTQFLVGVEIDTIASRFSWTIGEQSGQGIPPLPPSWVWPWQLPGPDGAPLQVNFALIRELLGPALAIAMLGAIESLLCAVVADGLTGTRHRPNTELVGQGIGNIITPFFGGITATAALARTATNIRAGARSPVAAVVHALVVLASVTVLAGVLSHLPMAALAALLMVVAWNMSEAKHFRHILLRAPRGDVAVLLTCFILTVTFDMVLAVGVGVGLAAALFILRMSDLTQSRRVTHTERGHCIELPAERVAVYDVNGPLFFGAADKAISTLHTVDRQVQIIILDMQDVPSVDISAIVSLQALIREIQRQNIRLIIAGLPARIIVELRRAGIHKSREQLTYCSDMSTACVVAKRWLAASNLHTLRT